MADTPPAEQPKQEGDLVALEKKMQVIAEERMLKKEQDLRELEARLDKKIDEFKKFVDKTEVQGRALAQPPDTKTEEEKAKAEINKFLDGTGLKI